MLLYKVNYTKVKKMVAMSPAACMLDAPDVYIVKSTCVKAVFSEKLY